MFLFGARQTGKSTLLKERFKGAVYYDLPKPNMRRAFKQNPSSLWEALQDKSAGTLVLVSLAPITRSSGETELIYVLDFLKMLWDGEIF